MAIKSLAVVAFRYPCNLHPTWHVFVRQIAHSFARQGVEVTVINPLSVHRALLGRDPFISREDAGDGSIVTVFRPRFFSLSSRQIGCWNTFRLTVGVTYRAALRILRRHLDKLPDAIYGHFMYPAGAVAVRLGHKLGIPSFPAAGEISLDTVDQIGKISAGRELAGATDFIANSHHLSGLMQKKLGIAADRIGVFPNGINRSIFFPRDKIEMRRKYGLPDSELLTAFIGSFEERKGAGRVAEAIRTVNGVSGVFIGGGEDAPQGGKVLFSRRVPHEQVPEVLSACDLFVLPTTDEGCCNAIIEAMACGLPVVSSTGAFNDDILSPQVSIRTDPLDVAAIRQAISRLRDSADLRARMAAEALRWSENFDIDQRAGRILEFMAARISKARQTAQ